jgi:hypothetical protein
MNDATKKVSGCKCNASYKAGVKAAFNEVGPLLTYEYNGLYTPGGIESFFDEKAEDLNLLELMSSKANQAD